MQRIFTRFSLVLFVFFIALFGFRNESKACHNSSVVLDSVVFNAPNFDVYFTLCIGGGVGGGGGFTGNILFAFYAPGQTGPLGFNPASVTSDTTGETLVGSNVGAGPLPFSPDFNMGWNEAAPNFGYTCINTNPPCGTIHQDCKQFRFTLAAIPDSIYIFGVEGANNPNSGCSPLTNPDMRIIFGGACFPDIVAPVITCPLGTNGFADSLCQAAVPNYASLTSAVDACDPNPVITQNPSPGTIVGLGVTVVTMTATDASGNSDSCTVNFTVSDTTRPNLTCPSNFSLGADTNCQGTVSNLSGLTNLSDNCDLNPTYSQSPPPGTTFSGSQVVNITGTDSSGNQSNCSVTITLVDFDAPVVTCPTDTTINAPSCTLSVPNFIPLASADDNCDTTFTFSQDPAPGTIVGTGFHAITIFATDQSGNQGSCLFFLTVQETVPPVVTCPPNQTLPVNSFCRGNLPNYVPLASATDNCDTNLIIFQQPGPGTNINGTGVTTTVSIIAQDANGNRDTCTFDVLTIDTIPPSVTCPANQNENPDSLCGLNLPDYTPLASANDNCDTSVTLTQNPAPGTRITGTTTLTIVATDDEGNTDSCTFDVILNDTAAPVLTCPADQPLYVDANCQATLPNYIPQTTVTDNCDNNPIVTQNPSPGQVFNGPGATQLVTITATDNLGNTDSCSFTVTVTDSTSPFINCPGPIPVPLDSNCQVLVPDFNLFFPVTDNCDNNPTVNQTPAPGTLLSGPQTVNVTIVATDSSGNTTTCNFPAFLIDTLAPVISCPPNDTVPGDTNCQAVLADYRGAVTVNDNCDNNPTRTQSPPPGTVFSGSVTVNMTITDFSGNSASCNFNVLIADTTPPVINCPGPQVLIADSNCSAILLDYTSFGTATDNCDTNVTITQNPAPGTTISSSILVDLIATDLAGNTATCNFPVNLQDTTPPVLTCPADQTEQPDSLCGFNLLDYRPMATVTDNCDTSVTLSQNPAPGTRITGTSSVTILATDDDGNRDSCTFNVILNDNTPPVVTCPGPQDIFADANCDAVLPDYVPQTTATDNCDTNVTVTQTPAPGLVLTGAGTTQQVTMVATDTQGNTDSCSFVVTVRDTTVPLINCPGPIAVPLDSNCQFRVPDFNQLSPVTDNCDNSPTVSQNPPPGTTLTGPGTTVVTIIATDASGNSDTCTFPASRVDTLAPSIVCPADDTVPGNVLCQAVLANYTGAATVSDNCDPNPSVTQNPAPGTVFSGAITVTLTAADGFGNNASCNFDVIVSDSSAPIINCPGNQTLTLDSACQATLPDYTPQATVVDNCDTNATVTQNPAPGTVINTNTLVTLTATDANGNRDSCSFNVNAVDTFPPTLTCPPDSSVSADTNCTSRVPDFAAATAVNDACDPNPTVGQSPPAGTTVGLGTTFVTVTSTDASGNSSSCSVNFNVTDDTAPALTCPGNQTENLDANCEITLADYTGIATATDNCDTNVTITQSPAPGTVITGAGTVTSVTMTATDDVGNVDSCSFTVTAQDVTAPALTCPADDTLFADANCEAVLADYTTAANVSDNCDTLPTVTQSPAPGTVLSGHGASRTVTIIATDASGNSDTCTLDVTLIDNTDPVVTCPGNDTISPGANCQATLADYTSQGTATDNCDTNLTITQNPAPGTTIQGATTVTLSATDNAGNTGSCTFDVILTDTVPPVVTCPGPQTIPSDANCEALLPDFTSLGTVSDNCDTNLVITQFPAPGTVINGPTVVTLGAADANNNADTCNFLVTLVDTTAPTLTCPPDSSASADANCTSRIPDFASLASVNDGCDPNPVVSQSPAAGTVVGLGTTVVTVTATDASGNSSTCTANFNVTDDTNPVVTCPGNQTQNLDANCETSLADYTGLATATDNCDSNVTITQSPAPGTVITGAGTVTTVTMTASDDFGNIDTCSFTVTAMDVTAPAISCLADDTLFADANCEAALADYTTAATVSDNCDTLPTVTQSPAPGTVLSGPGATRTVTIIATDATGNSDTCTFNVTLQDNTDPVVTCPGNDTISPGANCQATLADYTSQGTATDNCDTSLTITQNPAPGTTIQGATTVTLSATDNAGNTGSCTFDVILTDTVPPVVTCPGPQTIPSDANCEAILPDFTSLGTVSDNCDTNLVISQFPAPGTIINGPTVVTLGSADANNNTDTCNFLVTLVDTTAPTLTCPPDSSASADANCTSRVPDFALLASVNDGCDPNPVVSQSPAAGTVVGLGTTVVTVTATDASGNSSTCTANFNVTDDTNPVVTCPGNQTQNLDANCETSLADYTGLATATDNCDTNVTITQSPAPGTVITGAGTVTIVTMTATDDFGNIDTCSFTVTAMDVTAPAITCPADDTVSADANCEAALGDYTTAATVSDNCDTLPSVSQSPAPGTVLSGPGATRTITLIATDASGNSDTCTFNVTLQDNTDPVVTCPGNDTISPGANCEATLADYTSQGTATDNCDTSLTITQSPAPGTTIQGSTTVTLSSTDNAGNTGSCTFDVILTDTVSPVVTCPGTQTLPSDPNCQAVLPDYTSLASATDNCDSNVTITQVPAPGTIVTGNTVVTMVATDANNNVDTCNFLVTLTDVNAPAITCPADSSVSADANCTSRVPDFASLATVTDACDPNPVVTQSPAAGTVVGLGTTVVTVTATDAAGNSSSCTVNFNVTDDTSPAITCPGNQTLVLNANCQAPLGDYRGLATATDNCDTNVTITQIPAPATVISGAGTVTTVVLTATDAAGNTDTCSFTVTALDVTAPSITCPADDTLSADANCEAILADYAAMATVSDNCDTLPAVSQSPAPGTVLSGHGASRIVTLIATDASGNSDTCTLNVTLEDNTAPVVTCPGNDTISPGANCQATLGDYTTQGTVTDNCDTNLTITQSPAPGSTIQGATTVTLSSTDNAGNTGTCTFDVILTDTVPPVITCPGTQTIPSDANCQAVLPDFTGMATVTDNCDTNLVVTQFPAPGTLISGTTVVTLGTADANNNADTCNFTVLLSDTTAPVLTCPADSTVPADPNCQGRVPDFASLASVTDACDPNPTTSQSPTAGTVVGPGTTVVTVTATDASGNSSTCTVNFNVIEATPPVITCPGNQTQNLDGNCETALADYTSLTTATDNCDTSVTITQSPAPGTIITGAGTVTQVVMTATDDAGNTDTCSFTVTAQDVTAPAITCPADDTLSADANCEGTLADYAAMATVSDNCDTLPIVSQSPPPGTVLSGHGASRIVTLIATDASGNSDTCTLNVTLEDNTAPVVTCPSNDTLSPGANCQTTLGDYTLQGTATDNCDTNLTITQSPAPGTTIQGATTVTLSSTDNAGNTGSCTFDVILTDTVPPVITCPGTQTIAADSSCKAVLPDFTGMATVSDNCDTNLVVSQFPAPGTIISGTVQVTLGTADANNNTDTCSFTVLLSDTIAPSLTCPQDSSVAADFNCAAQVPDFASMATVADGCDPNPSVSQSPTAGTVVGPGITVVTVTATDSTGNSSTCTVNFEVIENFPPIIVCPTNQSQNVDANCEAALADYTSLATASDNCDTSLTITQDPAPGTIITGAGTVTSVSLIATDDAGNADTCTFTVTTVDATAPVITCPANDTVDADANCQATLSDYTGMATVADNCDPNPSVSQVPAPGTVITGAGTSQTVVIVASDAAGNVDSCSFVVTVRDTSAPSVTCPGPQTLSADSACEATLPDYTTQALATDNCDPNPSLSQNPAPGTVLSGIGTTTVTITGTDASGNSSSCNFTVTVADTTAPSFTCPPPQAAPVDANCELLMPDLTPFVVANDNCDPNPIVSQSPTPGTVFSGAGTVVSVTITGTDASGNSSQCTFPVTLVDTSGPVITCPADTTISADNNCLALIPDLTGGASTADNCDTNVVVSQSPTAGTVVGPGTTVVTLTATDASGNSSTCTTNVDVVENTPPVVTCPGNQSVFADANCEIILADYTSLTSATDNCDTSVTITQSPAPGTVFNGAGTNVTVTMTGTDDAGNTATCTFVVTIVDSTGPTVTCPADTTFIVDANCEVTVPDFTAIATVSDNCDPNVGLGQSPATGTILTGAGTTAVVLTATDVSGNSASCTFNMIREDNTAPQITCPGNDSAAVDANCEVTLGDYTNQASATDNCTANPTITQIPAPGTIISGGNQMVTVSLIATDNSGNADTCSFIFSTRDTIAPTFTCPNDTTVSNDSSQCSAVFTYPGLNASDNCPGVIVQQTGGLGSGSTFPLGTTNESFIVSDSAGNGSACSFLVTVIDSEAPVFTVCPGDTTINADSANCNPSVVFAMPMATDNCRMDTVIGSHAPGASFPVGPTTVTYTATDSSGNSSTCTFIVSVIPDTVVLIMSGSDVTCAGDSDGVAIVQATAGCLPYSYLWSTGDTTDTLTGLAGGTYIVTVTEGNGFMFVDSVVVSEPDPLRLTFAVTDENCPGAGDGEIDLAVSGGIMPYMYSWSTGDTIEDLDSLSGGVYVITVTDSNGCTAVDSATVVTGPGPLVDIGPDDSICAGDTLLLDAGPGYSSYTWSTGDTTQTLPVAVADTYWVEVTDSAGCTGRDSMILGILPNPVPTITISGDTLFSSSATSYQWMLNDTNINGATDWFYVATQTGTYSVMVTYANGCTNVSDTTFIVVAMEPGAIAGEISMFPNPAQEYVNLEILLTRPELLEIELISPLGVTVYRYTADDEQQSYKTRIDLQGLAQGVYFVVVKAGNGEWVDKLMKY